MITPDGTVLYSFFMPGEGYDRTHITYMDFLGDEVLYGAVSDNRRFQVVNLGHQVFIFRRQAMRGDIALRRECDQLTRALEENGLRFFAPSGPEALAFINDTESDVKMLRGTNQCMTGDTVLDTLDGPREVRSLYDVG